MLVSQCIRDNVSWSALSRWHFVDTLAVFRAVDNIYGGCVKLQCLLRFVGDDGLRAHRALDDTFALRSVVNFAAARLGVSSLALLRPFVVEMDEGATYAQLSCGLGL